MVVVARVSGSPGGQNWAGIPWYVWVLGSGLSGLEGLRLVWVPLSLGLQIITTHCLSFMLSVEFDSKGDACVLVFSSMVSED